MANFKLILQRTNRYLLLFEDDKCLYVKSRTGKGNQVTIVNKIAFKQVESLFIY